MSLEARNRALPEWLNMIATCRIVLPRFQRYEAWSNQEIRDLLLTALRGLPAGSLLTQKVEGEPLFKWRPLRNAPIKADGDAISALLLDGQQRLTALWRALRDDYDRDDGEEQSRVFLAHFKDGKFDAETVEIKVQPTAKTKSGARAPQWLDSPLECWKRDLVPVSLLHPEVENSKINQWAKSAADFSADKPQTVNDMMNLLGDINEASKRITGFQLPFLELKAEMPKEIVLDVFVKINRRAVRLSAFDVVVAQVESEGESLHDLVSGIKRNTPRLLEFDSGPEDLLLSVACLLQNKQPNQTGFFQLDLAQMVLDWPLIERGVAAGVQFLSDERVWDGARLPSEAPLAPLFALFANAPTSPDALGNFHRKMRSYLWRAFFTDRYESAAATAAFQDFRALRDAQNGTSSEPAPLFDASRYPLPSEGELIGAGWPKSSQRLARAVLLLSLRGQALDIADSSPLSLDSLKKREYHHLYPVAYLVKNGRKESEAMRALNCALISWRTNRTISDKAPDEYLAERVKAALTDAAPPEKEIRGRLATHGIDFDALARGDYDAFLKDRAVWALKGMKELCDGSNWPT